LLLNGGHTVATVHTDRREYEMVDDTTFQRLIGAALDAMGNLVTLHLADVKIETQSLGAGDSIAGYATRRFRLLQEYSVSIGAMGFTAANQHHVVVTDFWVSPDLRLPPNPLLELLATVETALAQRNEDFVHRSAAARVLVACSEPPTPPAAPGAPSLAKVRSTTPQVQLVVDVSQDTTAQNETPLAVNPLNPDNWVTGANDWNFNDGCAVNASFDGGRTWTPTLPNGFIPGLTEFTNDPAVPGTGIYEAAGDPAVAFGPDGTAYFACQAFIFSQPPFPIALFVSRSTDGGWTWLDGVREKPVQVSQWNGNGKSRGDNGQFPDHESIAVDVSSTSPFAGSVYVTWVQFNGFGGHSPVQVAFSRDGARTFSTPISVTKGPIRNNQDARIAIAPDGTLFLTFDNGIQG